MNIRRSSGALSEAKAAALLAGRGLAGHDDLQDIIGLMRTASTVPAPTPNAALAAMLDTGFAPVPVDSAERGSRWGRWAARVSVATAAAMTVTLGAGAANALPAPLQKAVADIVGALTPLQLPRPTAPDSDGSTNRGEASDDPAVVGTPDSGADEDDNPDESTAEPAAVTPTASPTLDEPAGVAPPRRPEGPAERDEPDEPDADEPDAEQPETDAPDADVDPPEMPDADAGDVYDQDVLDADEPALDVDGEPEQDTDGED